MCEKFPVDNTTMAYVITKGKDKNGKRCLLKIPFNQTEIIRSRKIETTNNNKNDQLYSYWYPKNSPRSKALKPYNPSSIKCLFTPILYAIILIKTTPNKPVKPKFGVKKVVIKIAIDKNLFKE